MAQLIKPITVALDTSVLNDVANDFFSSSLVRHKKAKDFISFFNSTEYTPIISFEHIDEILQTPIETHAKNSFEVINLFSRVLWIKSKSSYGFMVGNVHDIIGNEIKAFSNGFSEFSEIISVSKENAFVFSTGEEFYKIHHAYWPVLRSHSLYSKQKNKEIASILNLDLFPRETKISDLLKSNLNTAEEVRKNVISSKRVFFEQILRRGDRKLSNPQSVAFDFHSLISNDINQAIDQGEPLSVKDLLRTFGFSEDDLKECTTIGDLCDLASFREQLNTYARASNLNHNIIDRIRPHNIPSVKMINGVSDVCRRGKPHASGSDLIDLDLLVFTLYCDYTILDKRTLEFLKQYLAAVPLYKGLVNKYLKLPNYSELKNLI